MFSLILKYKNIIIGIVVVVLIFIGYGMFTSDKKKDVAPLSRVNSTATASTSEAPGRQFVAQLLAIQNISFNSDIFKDPAYLYLNDFSKELTPQNVGRDNPFAPIGQNGRRVTASSTPGFVITSTSTPRIGTSTPSRLGSSTRP